MKKLLQKRIVQDTIWYSIANVVLQASSLVGVLFVSRYLGPTNLGLYSFLQNYLAFFVTILSGLDIYANWHIVQSTNYYKELTRYVYLKAVITAVLVLAYILFSYFSLPSDLFHLSLLLIIPVITSIFSSYVFVLQYQNSTKRIAITMMLSALLILTAKLFAVWNAAPLSVFVAINSLDGLLLIVLCSYYIISTQKNTEKVSIQPRDFALLFSASFFPLLYILFWFIVVRVDQFLVPVYFNAYTLGVYSAAVKVIEMTNVLIVVMQAILLPRVTKLHDPKSDSGRTHISIILYGICGVIASVSIYILAPVVVHILFGPTYLQTVDILRVYAWSIPGLFISYLFSVIAMSKRSYKTLAYTTMILALVSTILSYLAAKTGNIENVALVSVFVYSVSATLFYLLWRKGIL